MPVLPVVWQPFGPAPHYPHMAKHDERIWERFLTRYVGYFTEAAYDIALGGTEINDPTATDAERRMWRFNTAKRIDAVCRNRDEVWLCEVRRGAGAAAVGAVVTYGTLSELDKWTTLPIVLTIVTDRSDPDTRTVAESLAIQLIELPEPDVGDEPRRS